MRVIDMPKIMINAGHHPILDWGAVNKKYNVHEADITRIIALKVIEFLDAAGGYECEFIQENELWQIYGAANRGNFDAFVSVHVDSFTTEYANGSTCFIYSYGGKAEKLANKIQNQIVRNLNTKNRGVREAEYAVLRETSMPAVLVECGYITNEHDVQLLMNPEMQIEFARSIALGITDYYEQG